ncbi:lantibiotic dehydratase C-terminal domain-containing protein [Arthrobacter sp. zg-Y820]|uniref:lantibiotic dehydratase C-terminal domain-containing protein n=2 Tax=Arthrobacter TaxID=1663 RepID=UPI0032E7F92C
MGGKMCRLTPDNGASLLNHKNTWWILTIQPARKEVRDPVVGQIVTPLAAQARVLGAERWSYKLSQGPETSSVQVRVLAPPAVLERLLSFTRALVNHAVAQLGSLDISEQRFCPGPSCWGGESVMPNFESALAKFGGLEGLNLAAEVGELSSDLAAWALSCFPNAQSRSPLAALLLFDTAHAMMRGPRSSIWADRRSVSWDYYWDSHLRGCTGSVGPQAAKLREDLTARLAPRIMPAHRLMAVTASEPAVENWRRRWSRAIDGYLYRADKERVSRSAQHLTVYQGSQLLNRLGFDVLEEAALGLYARSWSKDREATLRGLRP